MDLYKEYEQTSSMNEVYLLKKQGWEVIGTHIESYGDGSPDSKTVFTLGLSYKTVAQRLTSIINDIEELGFKDEIFRKVAEKHGEDPEEYEMNSFAITKNEYTKWVIDYEKNVHDKKVTLSKSSDIDELSF